jgi:hypothetical protein
MLRPEQVVRLLDRPVAQSELDDRAGETGLHVRLDLYAGDCRQLLLGALRERAAACFHVLHSNQLHEIDRRLHRRDARVVALAEHFQLARALQTVAPACRHDRRPELRDPLRPDGEDAGFERPRHPLVRARGV